MSLSDAHLEQSLAEYNELVSELENKEISLELVDALIHRGMVLMLMDSFVSCITDFEDALDICYSLEEKGVAISPGTYIRIFENRGQLMFDADDEQMFEDYSEIAKLLGKFDKKTKYYSENEVVTMCLACSEDLVDKSNFELAKPFVEKAVYVIGDKDDHWNKNRLVELTNISGQIEKEKGSEDKALDLFSESVSLCKSLGENLEDRMEHVFALVYSGDIYEERNDFENMEIFHERAIKILELMKSEGTLDDEELLVNLHQGLASKLMENGKIEEAEKHLMKVMELGYPIVKEIMDELGIEKKKS